MADADAPASACKIEACTDKETAMFSLDDFAQLQFLEGRGKGVAPNFKLTRLDAA